MKRNGKGAVSLHDTHCYWSVGKLSPPSRGHGSSPLLCPGPGTPSPPPPACCPSIGRPTGYLAWSERGRGRPGDVTPGMPGVSAPGPAESQSGRRAETRRSRTPDARPAAAMYDPERGWSLSFAGCGFLGIYHIGVTRCLSERAPHLLRDARRFFGASAGALHCAFLLSGVPLGRSGPPRGSARGGGARWSRDWKRKLRGTPGVSPDGCLLQCIFLPRTGELCGRAWEGGAPGERLFWVWEPGAPPRLDTLLAPGLEESPPRPSLGLRARLSQSDGEEGARRLGWGGGGRGGGGRRPDLPCFRPGQEGGFGLWPRVASFFSLGTRGTGDPRPRAPLISAQLSWELWGRLGASQVEGNLLVWIERFGLGRGVLRRGETRVRGGRKVVSSFSSV